MVKETMVAEGIREDQDTRRTNTGDTSECTGVTGGTSGGGTIARAMANTSARETVVQEKVQRAKAQQQANDLKAQVHHLRRDQVQTFMLNWDKKGLASVTTTPPTTIGHPGQHAWDVMTAVLADPCNKSLHAVCEDLAA